MVIPSANDSLDLLLNGRPLAAAPAVAEWQPLEFACLPPPGATLALRVGDALLPPFLRPGDPAWRWAWNPQNAVGRHPLLLRVEWPDGRSEELRGAVEVAPRKIDQECYALLLADLQRLADGLAYALAGAGAGAALRPAAGDAASLLAEHHALFGERFDGLERAVERIARRPHERLQPADQRVEPGQARDFSQRDWQLAMSDVDVAQDQSLITNLQAPLPAEITERSSRPSADTYENRLLKRLLDELWRRARLVAELAGRAGPAAMAVAERGRAVAGRVAELRRLPFLAEVGPLPAFHGPGPVFQRDPSYRVVYRYWQDLRRRPLFTLTNPLLHLPIHELPRLYESWCALTLAAALVELPAASVRAQNLVRARDAALLADEPELTIELAEDTPLLVLDWRGQILRLRYQPRYRPPRKGEAAPRVSPEAAEGAPGAASHLQSMDRHTRVPDLALEIERPGAAPAVLVLDAKYRLDAGGAVPEDALADAYTYLGSIGLPDGRRAARAAALLFPGAGPADRYPSGVAALPLLPGATGALRSWLEDMVTDTRHETRDTR